MNLEVSSQKNSTREKSLRIFEDILLRYHGDCEKSEIDFRNEFLEIIKLDAPELYEAGWYSPPPGGVSVIYGDNDNLSRISFETLRKEPYWPKPHTSQWCDNFLYFYCSSVPIDGSEIGDFALTLYFGANKRLRQHYDNCLKATSDVLSVASTIHSSGALFVESQRIFEEYGLINSVVSYTDVTPLDLGHTFPALNDKSEYRPEGRYLGKDQQEWIRQARQFVNGVSDWEFRDGLQFSVEPQLRSIHDPDLPQITFHYLLHCTKGVAIPERDIDRVISRWMN